MADPVSGLECVILWNTIYDLVLECNIVKGECSAAAVEIKSSTQNPLLAN